MARLRSCTPTSGSRCDATGAGCGDISGAGGTSYTPAASDVGQTIRVTVTASNSVGSSAATSAQTAPVDVASLSDPVIAAAGDLCSSSIGDCAGTADLLDQINPTAVLTLGDNAYEDGSLTQYNAEYKPYWGRQDSKVYPAPGNHEFQTPTHRATATTSAHARRGSGTRTTSGAGTSSRWQVTRESPPVLALRRSNSCRPTSLRTPHSAPWRTGTSRGSRPG